MVDVAMRKHAVNDFALPQSETMQPVITTSLIQRATEVVRGALTSTNKTTQDVEGDGNDLSTGEIP